MSGEPPLLARHSSSSTGVNYIVPIFFLSARDAIEHAPVERLFDFLVEKICSDAVVCFFLDREIHCQANDVRRPVHFHFALEAELFQVDRERPAHLHLRDVAAFAHENNLAAVVYQFYHPASYFNSVCWGGPSQSHLLPKSLIACWCVEQIFVFAE